MEETKAIPSTVTINLPNGPIVAAIEDDLIRAEGMRFASQKRFTPPLEVESWTEPIDCTKPGPSCPQPPLDFPPLMELSKLESYQDEDCLRAIVVAPAEARQAEKPLPVLVWIHGGAYVFGSGHLSVFDLRPIARQGIVVVCIQYRLGMFGYAQIDGVSPANLGLMDQIAALKWVQKNVSSFGGNPEDVTIFGQSAGGDAVYSLLVADGTEGLFRQAIMVSAPFGVAKRRSSLSNALTKYLQKHVKSEDLATMDVQEILKLEQAVLAAQKESGWGGPSFWVVPGQAPMPPLKEEASRLKTAASRVRIMIGWTKDDILPFLYMTPRAERFSHLPLVGEKAMISLGRVVNHFVFSGGARKLQKQYGKFGGDSTSFCIEWFPTGGKYRAMHCMEMPLLFDGAAADLMARPYPGAKPEVDLQLKREFTSYFVDFVLGGKSPQHITVKSGYKYKA